MPERRHPASLIPCSLHDPALVALVHQRVSIDMVCYIADKTRQLIEVEGENVERPSRLRQLAAGLPSPPPTPVKTNSPDDDQPDRLPALEDFLAHIILHSNLQVATLLTTLIYLDRLRPKLPKTTRGVSTIHVSHHQFSPKSLGMPCTRHRVLLATIVVAAKYLNDASPKNKHWAFYGRLFDVVEVNLMERQLLHLLDYDLRFDEAEALQSFNSFLPQVRSPKETRAAALERVQRASKARSSQAPSPPATPQSDAPSPVPSPALSSVSKPTANQKTSIYLDVPPSRPHMRSVSVPMPLNRSSTSLSSNSSSTGDSEPGSLTEDNGSSSSESEAEEQSPVKPRSFRKFVLRPIPTYAYRPSTSRTRGASAQPGSTSASVATKSPIPSEELKSPTLTRRTFDVASARRMSMYGATIRGPRVKGVEAAPTATGAGSSFFSRMWGAATKAAALTGVGDPKTTSPSIPTIHIVDPDSSPDRETRVHPLGPRYAPSIRRIVHSQSTVFSS
jgi:PHO85 cyclin-1